VALLRAEAPVGAEDVLIVVNAFHRLDEAVHGEVPACPVERHHHKVGGGVSNLAREVWIAAIASLVLFRESQNRGTRIIGIGVKPRRQAEVPICGPAG
jgi:hypothetical protein